MGIINEELQFHLKTKKDDIGEYVIMPGDPGRVPKIAKYLEDAVRVAQNREYNVYTGYLNGVKVSVCSTGIGGPSAAIAIEELINCGAHTFIRVGTSGGMAKDVVGGDLCIATAAVRGEGTSYEYISADYPAVADFDVVTALKQSAEELSQDKDGHRYHVGVVQSKDSFYGELSPHSMPVSEKLNERWESYLRCGCLTSEMEAAALFSVGLSRGVRVGAVLVAIWNVEREKVGLNNPTAENTERAIRCAVEAVAKLSSRGA